MELDRRQLELRTLIDRFQDLIPPQQKGGDGAARSTTDHLVFTRLKLHNRREAGPDKKAALMTEVEAARAESTEVVTKEATPKDAPAQVQVQVSSWQAQVYPKPPPRRVPSWQEELGKHCLRTRCWGSLLRTQQLMTRP